MISLAMDLVEKRLLDGSASSQETTHFLKLGTTTARIEKQILESQKELIVAKTKQIQAGEDIKELYANAMKAMSRYQGTSRGEEDD